MRSSSIMPTQRLAEAEPLGRAGQNGQVQVAARLLPGAEGAGGGVLADRFARVPLEGEFPIVNDAGALGGQMGRQAGFDQAIHQRAGAVFHKVAP